MAHKIRLFDSGNDLSKYILFDSGLANYLLNGSDLLRTRINDIHSGILYETVIGNEIISGLVSRDDLFYWKSDNVAEIDFLLRSPNLVGIDVKKGRGDNKSLHSFALQEKEALCLVKIYEGPFSLEKEYEASLPTSPKRRRIPLLKTPHYLTSHLTGLLEEMSR
ncbi:MAG: DUF4143 domain-containing protein [Deltaproteobacteria bacterium]|nr:DUF4143 domain-containing protein [Deltaproteobacteria bacterium]